jgi:hypothetical protein
MAPKAESIVASGKKLLQYATGGSPGPIAIAIDLA